jgi:Dolichyl-phosphate-mannose-protein mannosyltransferase
MRTEPTANPGSDVIKWRLVLPSLLAIFLATRAIVVAIAALVEAQFAITDPTKAWSSTPILTSLTTSDSVYYLGIASGGYHVAPISGAYHDYVFFPFFPAVVRITSILTLGNTALAGVLVSNVAFFLALVVLYALVIRHLDHDTAIRSLAFLAMAPGAVAFAMAYGDSLFLLLAAGAMLAAERRRYVVMGILYGLASLTRLPGVLLAVPLVVQLIADQGRRPTRDWAWLALGPIALAAFYGYLWALTGDLLANLHGQAAWDAPAAAPITGGSIATRANPLVLFLIVVLLIYAFLFVYAKVDRTPKAQVAWAVTAFASVLVGGRLLSAPRYLAIGWPFSTWLGGRRSIAFQVAWPIIWAGLFAVFAFLNFTTQLAP